MCLVCLEVCNLTARISQLSVSSCLFMLLLITLHTALYPLFFPDFLTLFSKDLLLTLLQMVSLSFIPVYVIRSGVGCFSRK